MLQEVNSFMKGILAKWVIECWSGIQESMATSLLKRDDDENLAVNFSENLKVALKDIKVIRLLECDLTPNLIKFFSLEENLWVSKIMRA